MARLRLALVTPAILATASTLGSIRERGSRSRIPVRGIRGCRSRSGCRGGSGGGAFIKQWYDRGFSTPEGRWPGYDIHHIVLREYGGTNPFENLVPVDRSVHQSEFNPWWRGY